MKHYLIYTKTTATIKEKKILLLLLLLEQQQQTHSIYFEITDTYTHTQANI